MCVEHLYLTKYRMGKDDAGRGFADEPVSCSNVYGRAIQRVRVY